MPSACAPLDLVDRGLAVVVDGGCWRGGEVVGSLRYGAFGLVCVSRVHIRTLCALYIQFTAMMFVEDC